MGGDHDESGPMRGKDGFGGFRRPPRCADGFPCREGCGVQVAGGEPQMVRRPTTTNAGHVRYVLVSLSRQLRPPPREARPRQARRVSERSLDPETPVRQEHCGPQSAGAARWLCFIWPRRKFIFGVACAPPFLSQSQARGASWWVREVVTWTASAPRSCRSHKAGRSGQERSLSSPLLSCARPSVRRWLG